MMRLPRSRFMVSANYSGNQRGCGGGIEGISESQVVRGKETVWRFKYELKYAVSKQPGNTTTVVK